MSNLMPIYFFRYMSINIHSKKGAISLGAVRVYGTMPAAKAVAIIRKRLQLFGLDLDKDVVSSTTDGASVMKSFGRMTSPQHVQCMSHGIHLAVCDVLYQAKDVDVPSQPKRLKVNEERDKDGNDDGDDDGDGGDGDGDDDGDDGDGDNENDVDLSPDYESIIEKVRSLVRTFKYSPVKNEENLQRYVVQSNGQEYSLFLDCKTRWSSILTMLQRFRYLKKELECALIQINKTFDFSNNEISAIEEIIKALEPIKAAIDALGADDSDLVVSEKIIKFVMMKLQKNKSSIGKKLYEAFRKRVGQRRNTYLIHLMEYLKNPSFVKNTHDHMGERIRKKDILRLAMEFAERLFPVTEQEERTSPPLPSPPTSTAFTPSTAKNELYSFLATNELVDENESHHSSGSSRVMTQAMRLYETSGERPPLLEKLYQAIATIKPTSVEAERAFSALGYFCTKQRNRLGPKTLDVLIFLRHYYSRK